MIDGYWEHFQQDISSEHSGDVRHANAAANYAAMWNWLATHKRLNPSKCSSEFFFFYSSKADLSWI